MGGPRCVKRILTQGMVPGHIKANPTVFGLSSLAHNSGHKNCSQQFTYAFTIGNGQPKQSAQSNERLTMAVRPTAILCLAWLFTSGVSAVFADVVILKDGTHLEGIVIIETSEILFSKVIPFSPKPDRLF